LSADGKALIAKRLIRQVCNNMLNCAKAIWGESTKAWQQMLLILKHHGEQKTFAIFANKANRDIRRDQREVHAELDSNKTSLLI
jgi:hypothetical protein